MRNVSFNFERLLFASFHSKIFLHIFHFTRIWLELIHDYISDSNLFIIQRKYTNKKCKQSTVHLSQNNHLYCQSLHHKICPRLFNEFKFDINSNRKFNYIGRSNQCKICLFDQYQKCSRMHTSIIR